MLIKNIFQTIAQLEKSSQVDVLVISKSMKVLRMIQKQGHWLEHEMNLEKTEIKGFSSISVMKTGFISIIQSTEDREVCPATHQHLPQNELSKDSKLFFIRMSFVMS